MRKARTQKDPRDPHAVESPMDQVRSFLQMHEDCPGGPPDLATVDEADGLHVALCCAGCAARLTVVLDSDACRAHLLRRARAAGFAGSDDELWALGEAELTRVLDSPTASAAWLPETPPSKKRSH
jgi:hypothetical protein